MSDFDKVKYNNEYAKQNYDRLNIQVPKGYKSLIEEHFKAIGYNSLNAYVKSLIEADTGLKMSSDTKE